MEPLFAIHAYLPMKQEPSERKNTSFSKRNPLTPLEAGGLMTSPIRRNWIVKDHITPALILAILEQYALPLDGIHGIGHWARVYENGMSLADITGADHRVVSLFSVLHDACRFNEGSDPEHGKRGANLAVSFRGSFFDLPDDAFERLYEACSHHTHSHTHQDITIKTCWDADRLDLGRVGIMPDPECLCTDEAKTQAWIANAYNRSIESYPEWLFELWGISS